MALRSAPLWLLVLLAVALRESCFVSQQGRGALSLLGTPQTIFLPLFSGLHTLQRMYGCEFCADGTKEGFEMLGYDGSTFLIFDTETRTWVAPDPQAQITQRKWDADTGYNQRIKVYLEEICIEWLKKHLSYGKEMLQRTEPPGVTVRGKTESEDGLETHVCRLDGFYPREIDAFWMRDGEVWLAETFHGFLAPNADGTYHYWLSIRIDPKERGRYR
ncbi:Major histocompatibility complex class I-related protein, partial [Ophiophagus hannah]